MPKQKKVSTHTAVSFSNLKDLLMDYEDPSLTY